MTNIDIARECGGNVETLKAANGNNVKLVSITVDSLDAFAARIRADASLEAGANDEWRRLALQFDGHRMQALGHLKTLLAYPKKHAEAANSFLQEPPLDGAVILAERIAGMARQEPEPEQPHPEDLAKWRLGWERYEKARKLQPVRWAEICKRALAGERFDDLIDALPGRSHD